MAANVEAMVRTGIEAYRNGKKAEARTLLEKAIELDDYNEQAWMWLSAVVETQEEKRTCLENVLVINPDNEEAQRGLKMLGVDGGASVAPSDDEAEAANPFTDTGMSEFGDVDFRADMGDEGEWSAPPTATSSASSTYQGPEVSSGEYDNWVDGLGLGNESQSAALEASEPTSTEPAFDATGFEDMFGLEDDNVFGTDDPFGSETQFDEDDIGAATFTSGPFGSPDVDDDLELDSDLSTNTQKQSRQAIVSPGKENIDDNLFGDLDSADFSSSSDFSGGDFFTGDEDFDVDGQADFSPDELFSFIPKEINATRLPGTTQRVGIVSILILLVLIGLNVGAVVFIMSGVA